MSSRLSPSRSPWATRLRIPVLALAACALSLAPRAQQVFTDQALFIAASGPLSAESFECFPAAPTSSSAPIVAPAFTLTIAPWAPSTVAPMNVQAAPNPSGPHATDGTRFVQCGATPSTNGQFELTIAFAGPVQEFGLTVTDFGEYAQLPGTLSATVLGSTYTIAANPPAQPDGGERFWGLRAPGTPFTSVVLRKTTQGDGIGIDELLHTDLGLPDHCSATWADLGLGKAGSAGVPQLTAVGRLAAGSDNQLDLSGAKASATATLVFGLSQIDAPFKGGTLVPQPLLLVTLATGPAGTLLLPFVFPAGVPAGLPLYFQIWVQDPGASFGLSASNALRGVTS